MLATRVHALPGLMIGGQAQPAVTLRQGSMAAARRQRGAARIVAGASKLSEVPQAPPDPILGISEAFKASDSPDKLNLGVGAYRTEELKPYVLDVVKKAERRMLEKEENKEYLPIEGLADFRKATMDLMLGPNSKAAQEGRLATLQSLSGTGSLRLGAEFLAKFLPGTKVFLSNPTWGNHNNIFADARVEAQKYRYFDPETVGLDFDGMMADLGSAPEGSVVVLHACAHNPTGVDPTLDQWKAILELVKERSLLPFFDSAYQGFASGDLERDAAAVRLFANAGVEMLLAQSYAKNMGLYGERVGALSVLSRDAGNVKRVESQLKQVIRAMYSSPPRHGAEIAQLILSDRELFDAWKVELKGMADRINAMRTKLFAALQVERVPGGWSHVVDQIGMFSFTGLTADQVAVLTNKYHIYLTKDGRISMAGLNEKGCQYLAAAIKDAVSH